MGELESSGQVDAVAPVSPASESAKSELGAGPAEVLAVPETAVSPAPDRAAPIWKRWLLALDLQELAVIVALLGLCVLVKVLWLTPVDIYTDAGEKWHFVRQWPFANDFQHGTWSHHMARLGINVPVFFVQKLWGTSPGVYYVAPVASFTLQILFVYLIAARLGGRMAALLAALLLIFSTGMTRSASQLLPDGFGGTAGVIVCYFLIRFEEQIGRKRLYWLLAAGLGSFYAYWIKESDVLLWPGVVIAVWLSRRSFREAAIVIAVMLGFVAVETLCFRLFTQYSNRFAIVDQVGDWYPPIKFVDLFDRIIKLDASWQMLFWLWVPSVLWLAGSQDKRARPVVLMGLSFMFLLTFMVRSIHPLVQWTAFKPRYLAVAAPFFVISIGMFFGEMGARVWRAYAAPAWQVIPAHFARWGTAWTCALCLLLGAASYRLERDSLPQHPLVDLKRDARILNDAYRRNLPIVQGARDQHGVNTIAQVYLDVRYLAQADSAKGGRLPDIPELVRETKRGAKWAYILRDASAYHSGELQTLVDQGCAITVTSKGRVKLDRADALPATCTAPRGQPIPL